jgi:hypothetical protein
MIIGSLLTLVIVFTLHRLRAIGPVLARVIDFLDDALVIEYNRSPLVKTLRITVEESYSLQGEVL